MYESHFSFSATPFNLNPDPSFYFESRGHGHALSYLKFGVYQGEGFVVVTGEIGAGKTTLVRTLLAGVDPKEIVAAQIVSTQLDAGDLLRSVALAFGISPKNLSKAELIATIEAFLMELVIQKKRALLVVDEAQNLNLAAIEELRMLSNFQLGNHALLQSFLIGQPELRTLLTSKPMEQLRQRVIASCHLGAMDRQETEAYIRHRLGRVGWVDNPSFEPAAFDEVFAATGGVPRRVNLLCNRLLLATFLQSRTNIDGDLVRTVAREVLSELGEFVGEDLASSEAEAVVQPPEVHPIAAEPAPGKVGTDIASMRLRMNAEGHDGSLLLVSGSRADDVKLAMLMRALKPRKGLPPMILVRLGDEAMFASGDSFLKSLGVHDAILLAPVSGVSAPARMADAISRFEVVVDELRPRVVVTAGPGDAVLAAALVCHKKGVRLVDADAGRRIGRPSRDVNSVLIEQLSEIFYAPDKAAFDRLSSSGAPKSRMLQAGDLLGDAVRVCLETRRALVDVLAHVEAVQPWLEDKRNFGIVGLSCSIDARPRDELAEYLSLARQVSHDIPLLWPISGDAQAQLDALGLRNIVDDSRILLLDPLSYPDMIALLSGATLVLTDSHHVEAEATAAGVPCLRLDQDQESAGAVRQNGNRKGEAGRNVLTLSDVKRIGQGARPPAAVPKELDGHAAERMADHLAQWLLSTALVAQLVKT